MAFFWHCSAAITAEHVVVEQSNRGVVAVPHVPMMDVVLLDDPVDRLEGEVVELEIRVVDLIYLVEGHLS